MRKRFESQLELDATPISEVVLDTQSRDELPQLLAGLQYIFITPSLNSAIFELLEHHIVGDKKRTGRLGMFLWEIFVFGTVRLVCNWDYDKLVYMANCHEEFRGILGVHTTGIFNKKKKYKLQSVKDNVGLLTEDLLDEINLLIVEAGHDLLKKKEGVDGISLKIKADSFVAESNVAFPTDYGLLYTSLCKSLGIIERLLKMCEEVLNKGGWRKLAYNFKKLKKSYRRVSNIHRKKGRDYQDRLSAATKIYLERCSFLSNKVANTLLLLQDIPELSFVAYGLSEALKDVHQLVDKHIDLVDRRILKGETIPHEEKIFSIYERHVEWINKGKAGGKVELGHLVLIATDQYHFILQGKVVVGQVDSDLVIPLTDYLKQHFGEKEGYTLDRLSLDRGFYSQPNEEYAEKQFNEVVMPKKGKKSVARAAKESTANYRKAKDEHSAIESNINELNHCGVKKVPDKGLPNFKKYVALGICAYNLKRLGKVVIEQKKLSYMKATSELVRKAA